MPNLSESIKEHIKEHEILGIKRFKIGNSNDYFEIDPANHTAKLVLNGTTVQTWP